MTDALPTSLTLTVVFLLLGIGSVAQGQTNSAHHDRKGTKGADAAPVLQEPGQSVFGTVQEAIRELEADSTTDWSKVNVDRLRRHLLDMHHAAVDVVLEDKSSIERGVRLRVRPTTDEARASLARILEAHPMMLKQEAGWTMEVKTQEPTFVLRITTEDPGEVEKIRALGYMGLLAYGSHHQRHHWHLVQGNHPHK